MYDKEQDLRKIATPSIIVFSTLLFLVTALVSSLYIYISYFKNPVEIFVKEFTINFPIISIIACVPIIILAVIIPLVPIAILQFSFISIPKNTIYDFGNTFLNFFIEAIDLVVILISSLLLSVIMIMGALSLILYVPYSLFVFIGSYVKGDFYLAHHVVAWFLLFFPIFMLTILIPVMFIWKKSILSILIDKFEFKSFSIKINNIWSEMLKSEMKASTLFDNYYFPLMKKMTNFSEIVRMMKEFKIASIIRLFAMSLVGTFGMGTGIILRYLSKYITVRNFAKITLPIKYLVLVVFFLNEVFFNFFFSFFIIFTDKCFLPITLFIMFSIFPVNTAFYNVGKMVGFLNVGLLAYVFFIIFNIVWMFLAFSILTPIKDAYNVVSSFFAIIKIYLIQKIHLKVFIVLGVISGFVAGGYLYYRMFTDDKIIMCTKMVYPAIKSKSFDKFSSYYSDQNDPRLVEEYKKNLELYNIINESNCFDIKIKYKDLEVEKPIIKQQSPLIIKPKRTSIKKKK